MSTSPHASYQTASVATADRGKLVVMVYDHCIQWCDRAIESTEIEGRSRAISRVQAGLTELTCALDLERGGDIARNLWRLYDFMSWTLSQCLIRKVDRGIQDVRKLLSELRSAWQIAAEEVRRTQPELVSGQSRSFALVG
jgi:flagellar protein FliS